MIQTNVQNKTHNCASCPYFEHLIEKIWSLIMDHSCFNWCTFSFVYCGIFNFTVHILVHIYFHIDSHTVTVTHTVLQEPYPHFKLEYG